MATLEKWESTFSVETFCAAGVMSFHTKVNSPPFTR